METFEHLAKPGDIAFKIPASIRSEDVRRVGHQRALCRTYLTHKIEKLRRRVALDIKLDGQHCRKIEHILPSDVASIRTGMHGNAVAPCLDTGSRRLHDAWSTAAARVAQRSNLVEIDAEFGHGKKLSRQLEVRHFQIRP